MKDLGIEGSVTKLNEDLSKWTSKHRPILSLSVIDCLDLQSHPDVRKTEIMVVKLTYKPESPNMRTRFQVDAASAAPLDELIRIRPILDSIPEQRRIQEDEQLRQGMVGTAMCLLICTTQAEVFRVVPVSFPEELLRVRRNMAWEARLKKDTLTGTLY
ncbi:hypothetical protein K439DRAFT_1636447 [Ramaria rubella]|nr:hypothetical protein K439DRAFT_1636447 [Ramaria rubella]